MNVFEIEGIGVIERVHVSEMYRRMRADWHPNRRQSISLGDYLMVQNISIPSKFIVGVDVKDLETILRLKSMDLTCLFVFLTNARSLATQTFALFTNHEDAATCKLMT